MRLKLRYIAIVIGEAVAALAMPMEPVGADGDPVLPTHQILIGGSADNPGAGVRVATPGASSSSAGSSGGSGGSSAGGGRARRCSVFPRATAGPPIYDVPQTPVGAEGMVAGGQYVVECAYADDGSMAYRSEFDHNPTVPGGGLDVAALAQQVYEQVPLVLPQAHTAPPPEAQLVGFPVWLWLGDDVWRDFDASASLAGITVTVTAHPRHARWNLGDGTTKTCGQGTAWTPRSTESHSDCDHIYQYVSDGYDARVTMVWSVSWSASTGQSGSLPDASRTTSFAMDVGERQAVITYGS